MTGGPPASQRPRRSSPVVVRRRRLVVALIAVLAAALVAVIATTAVHALFGGTGPGMVATVSSPRPTPKATPLTPEEALLKTAADPAKACAVSFQGDGISLAPMLQTEGVLFTGLPIPERAGSVFAGWYLTPEAAQAQTQADRVNGSQLTTCVDHRRTLHAAWVTPEQNTAAGSKIPILMYHWFTTKLGGEDNWLKGNYVYVEDFKAQMSYIATAKFYLPTWDELNAFIDGKLFLPPHSVIITDDDNEPTWFQLAVPVITEDKLLATSFVITSTRQDGSPSPYVLQRSHTHDMHRAGDNGKGRMVNLSADEVAADLEQSAKILGAKEVIAYPFGHYNATAEEGVTKAGFLLARTTESGYVKIGTPKLELPVIRVNYGDTADDLKRAIG